MKGGKRREGGGRHAKPPTAGSLALSRNRGRARASICTRRISRRHGRDMKGRIAPRQSSSQPIALHGMNMQSVFRAPRFWGSLAARNSAVSGTRSQRRSMDVRGTRVQPIGGIAMLDRQQDNSLVRGSRTLGWITDRLANLTVLMQSAWTRREAFRVIHWLGSVPPLAWVAVPAALAIAGLLRRPGAQSRPLDVLRTFDRCLAEAPLCEGEVQLLCGLIVPREEWVQPHS
jgi:hypothetical protein